MAASVLHFSEIREVCLFTKAVGCDGEYLLILINDTYTCNVVVTAERDTLNASCRSAHASDVRLCVSNRRALACCKDDILVCICYPRDSREAISAAQFAVARGAEVVAITDSEHSPLYKLASASLLAENEMISFVDSMVAPLSLINALLVALAQRMGTDVSTTFAELEDIWNEYGVFGKMDDE